MSSDRFTLTASDGIALQVHHWLPAQTPRLIIQLTHGMADHAGRYGALGQALNEAGHGLYAHDQRGHGLTDPQSPRGLYARADGWRKVLADVSALREEIARRHPGVPIVLLGHSMGSYVAQAWLIDHASEVAGAILSGSNFQPPGLYRAARQVARLERWRLGATGRSALIDWLSFGSFNKAFKPNRTPFDWLSRDEQAVDAYIRDPLCGFRCTNQLWIDLLGGLITISQPEHLARVRPGLALLIIGGKCDPVSAGERLINLASAWRDAAKARVQTIIYPQARHEVFNELNRAQVFADMIAWLDATASVPE
ncbi:alpha/beta hydrolase [Pseudomonas sp. dw_358]|uniref:alpha/beta hydrolase n=1 Tax=Pseudomonas sp. dw_358 TaxID=2720083 RepID=UPI001BD6789E|nr:alpha/beta hydrolase [Pseudomonas sp. dw_358]